MSRRFSRKRSKQIIGLGVALLIIAVRWWTGEPLTDAPTSGDLAPGEYDVERVVDGDTILLRKGHARVRFQGIDTPETVKEGTAVESWGPEASAYTKKFIREAGWRVRLEFDGEPTDQYGRYLVFIWSEGRMLNEELVHQGLARAKLGYDYSNAKKNLLRRAQDKARRERRGIWSKQR